MQASKEQVTQKNKVVRRLQIAKGHLEKVLKMVVDDEYCIDIVHQSLAVQAALKKVDQEILENHLKCCVADSIKEGKTDKVVSEIMEVLQKK